MEEVLGRLLIGTVEGDIHDIGRNTVITIDAIREYNPDIVGMSGLLTIAIESMKKTIDAIREAW